jgi:crossover junction endodeoxyribonuclease RuvC
MVAKDVGVIRTPAGDSLPHRLHQLSLALTQILEKWKPDAMAVEELFFNTNVKTALTVGQARGVILLTGAQFGCPIESYTPPQVKMAVCGYGKADKKQVQEMVKRLLNLSEIPKPDDAADALAIAICHAQSYRFSALRDER